MNSFEERHPQLRGLLEKAGKLQSKRQAQIRGENSIFQKILEAGDSEGDLKILESELLKRKPEYMEEFSRADSEEAERVRKYLMQIFVSGNRYAYFFSS